MTALSPTVFVLGAGFTRAFLPAAPLMEDDYDGDRLEVAFERFRYARRLLQLERKSTNNGFINIERLMTRLDGGMPYDFEAGAREETTLLLSHVKRAFMDRLKQVKSSGTQHNAETLNALARYCVENCVMCVTFNYDDVFDEALWKVRAVSHESQMAGDRYWHPDGGYGFFCKPCESMIRDIQNLMDVTSMHLLKLHGSVNWRTKRGDPSPYAIDSVRHYEDWVRSPLRRSPWTEGIQEYLTIGEFNVINLHLDPEPFIVPPVLVKAALVEQPVLRLVWYRAFEAMKSASRVVFLGYSLPSTDLAASILFREAIPSDAEIIVVNIETARRATIEAYSRIFPTISEAQFDFRGVLEWSREFLSAELNGKTGGLGE